MIKLRGHHLICLHFFRGEFIENLRRIIKRVESGEEIEVCSGADYVCKMCPYLKGRKCLYDKDAEIEIREMDRNAVKLLSFKTKDKVTWMDIKNRFPEIFIRWSRKYCTDCNWRWACEKKNNFKTLINEKVENKL
jgi:hypothetical protein